MARSSRSCRTPSSDRNTPPRITDAVAPTSWAARHGRSASSRPRCFARPREMPHSQPQQARAARTPDREPALGGGSGVRSALGCETSLAPTPDAFNQRSERSVIDPPLSRGLRRGDRLRREGAVLAWRLVWRPCRCVARPSARARIGPQGKARRLSLEPRGNASYAQKGVRERWSELAPPPSDGRPTVRAFTPVDQNDIRCLGRAKPLRSVPWERELVEVLVAVRGCASPPTESGRKSLCCEACPRLGCR